GFEILFIGPDEDPFWAMVGRDNVVIMLKAIADDIKPISNPARHPWARWDAYIGTDDPAALFEEYTAKGITFHQPLKVDGDRLLGFELQDGDGYMLFFGR